MGKRKNSKKDRYMCTSEKSVGNCECNKMAKQRKSKVFNRISIYRNKHVIRTNYVKAKVDNQLEKNELIT